MIESNIIKRFIVRSYMQNAELNIEKVAEQTFNMLSGRYLLNENVIVLSEDAVGKIIKCSKDMYIVQMQNNKKLEVPVSELKRKTKFAYPDIYMFLESITKVTPFGRVVIENVFDKITQPGFGGKEAVNERGYRNVQKEVERVSRTERTNKTSTQPSVFQSIEVKSPTANTKHEDKFRNFDTNTLKKVEISGFEGMMLVRLIKLYTFAISFKTEHIIDTNVTLEKFAEYIAEPEYSEECIMKLHKLFIEAIEKDISTMGNRFLSELKLAVGRLPEHKAESLKESKKRKGGFDKENWKAQTKVFLNNFCNELGDERISRFIDFAKKENTELRLEFLEFLFTLFAYTDKFKGMVAHALIGKRPGRIPGANKMTEESSEESVGQIEQQESSLENPLLGNIGRYHGHIIFMCGQTMLVRKGYEFFAVELNQMRALLKEMYAQSKAERTTIVNYKSIMEELINKNK